MPLDPEPADSRHCDDYEEGHAEEEQPWSPLMPERAMEYLDDANRANKSYLKAVSIRNSLEAVAATVLVHIAAEAGSATGLEKKRLEQKIDSLKDFFPSEILQKIHCIRRITNKGAHFSGHKDLTPEQIHEALSNISRVCEWVISSYLQKHGFSSESWLPTVLSTLQPCYRVRILEDLLSTRICNIEIEGDFLAYQSRLQQGAGRIMIGDFSLLGQTPDCGRESQTYNEVLLIIDKLAMAYLKDRKKDQSIAFIDSCFERKLINELFRKQMIYKLELLWAEIDDLPIARSIRESKRILEEMIPAIRTEERSLFLVVVMAIVSQEDIREE